MIYLQSYNERFYYNLSSNIDIFIKSYYDYLINLKQMIEEDDHRIDYFKENIMTCFSLLVKDFLNKFSEKKLDKFKSKVKDLEEMTNKEVFSLTELNKLVNDLSKMDFDEEFKSSKLKNICGEYYSSIDKYINEITEFVRVKIEKDIKWEVINGLIHLQSNMPKKDYKKIKYLLQIEFLKLQEWVKKNDKKILILFDGRDGAGKGSNIYYITEHLDPKHFRTETFGIPTKEESKNWFKRYENVLPKKGEIVFFDRSWYNRAYVEKPMDYCSDSQYENFMDDVVSFEKDLIDKNIDVIKIWLSIDKEIQKYRFEMRKSNPLKYWKYSNNDEKILNRWNDFTFYINLMIKKTNKVIKWNVINSNDERESTINSMRSILNNFNYDHKDSKLVKGDDNFISESKINDKLHLFLDIDGVFIPFESEDMVDHQCFYEMSKWSKEAVKNLNELYEEFKPKIVIISSYARNKTEKQIQDAFKKIGFIGKINHDLKDKSKIRFEEVEQYVKSNNIKHFIIVDDQNHDIEKVPELRKIWCQPDITKAFTKVDLSKCRSIIRKEGL